MKKPNRQRDGVLPGAGMSSWGPITSLMDCTQIKHASSSSVLDCRLFCGACKARLLECKLASADILQKLQMQSRSRMVVGLTHRNVLGKGKQGIPSYDNPKS